MLNHSIDEDCSLYCRKIIFYSVAELESKFVVKKVMGMHGEIEVYVINGLNFKKWLMDEIAQLGEAMCLIEESPKGTKICTIDKKYQIRNEMIKEVVQIRFDDFDWFEGYVNFVKVGDLDGNDLAALEMYSENNP